MTSWKIVFNSGQSGYTILSSASGSRVNYIHIRNSNESYFKDAIIDIFGDLDDIHINSNVQIFIDNNLEFSGYVSRIQYDLAGIKKCRIQCVGKTYDLWRYKTSSNVVYEDTYSAYIVSSLVANFTDIIPPDVSSTDGNFVRRIDLSDTIVGEAIGRLSKFDGYHFFVDNTGRLVYFKPSSSVQFVVTDADILKIKNLEDSDDFVRNDILVRGARTYEEVLPRTLPTHTGSFYTISSSSFMIAQKFPVIRTIRKPVVSYITALASRSSGSNAPLYLSCSIWDDVNNFPSGEFSETRFSWSTADISPSSPTDFRWLNPKLFTNELNLEYRDYWFVFSYDGANSSSFWRLSYSPNNQYSSDLSSDVGISGSWYLDSIFFGRVYWHE